MKNIKGLKVLERSDFERWCPSFYAERPADKASDKYAFLNTRDIAAQLWESGWMPVYAREARSIKAENRGFTKHIVRWANPDLITSNGDRIELVGSNSHNTASAFTFMAGIFRLVCTNGLITQTSDMGSIKVIHRGDIEDQVKGAINQIQAGAGLIAGEIDRFKTIELTPDEQGVFSHCALNLVYDDPRTAPITSETLLNPRRNIDARQDWTRPGLPASDLWTTYNVVQENLIKGGLRGRKADGKRTKTRRIHSIDKDIRLNTALWTLAEKMADIKAA